MNQEAINKRIQTLKLELAKLEEELLGTNKFKFIYDESNKYIISHDAISKTSYHYSLALSNFRYRQTEANAKADFQLQKELMCIGALAEQIDPDYKSKIDWNYTYSGKYFISYDVKKNTYVSFMRNTHRELGVVYMPKDVAEKVCEILNNKGVEL